jgi:hypothetical protein
LDVLQHRDVLLDVAARHLRRVHRLAALRPALQEALLELQELLMTLDLAFDVLLVERVARLRLL